MASNANEIEWPSLKELQSERSWEDFQTLQAETRTFASWALSAYGGWRSSGQFTKEEVKWLNQYHITLQTIF